MTAITTSPHITALSWFAGPADRSVVRLPGTNRAVAPAETLVTARRAATVVGVTRVADITRLDTIGIPTVQAIRPLARTVAVSQGKGVTAELATVSAIMEAVEIWHVEQPMTPRLRAAAAELDGLGYPVGELARATPSLFHDRLPLDWLAARSLVDGAATLVPLDVVRLSLERRTSWSAPAFFASTNGLASGNTRVEAALHALYEIVERDATTAVVRAGGSQGEPADPRSLGSPVVDGLCALLDAAGVRLWVRHVPSRTRLPCFMAWVACDDYPAAMFGFGCHLSPVIALTRAITEAAQARLAYISGARDDLSDDTANAAQARWLRESGPLGDLGHLVDEQVVHERLVDDLDHVVSLVCSAFGAVPLVVDLTREDVGVPVVKVVAPGAAICSEVL